MLAVSMAQARSLIDQARQALQVNDMVVGLAALEQAMALHRDSAGILMSAVRLALSVKAYEQADDWLAAYTGKSGFAIHMLKAEVARASGKLAECLAILAQMTASETDQLSAMRLMQCAAEVSLEREQDAILTLQRCLREGAISQAGLRKLAELAYTHRQFGFYIVLMQVSPSAVSGVKQYSRWLYACAATASFDSLLQLQSVAASVPVHASFKLFGVALLRVYRPSDLAEHANGLVVSNIPKTAIQFLEELIAALPAEPRLRSAELVTAISDGLSQPRQRNALLLHFGLPAAVSEEALRASSASLSLLKKQQRIKRRIEIALRMGMYRQAISIMLNATPGEEGAHLRIQFAHRLLELGVWQEAQRLQGLILKSAALPDDHEDIRQLAQRVTEVSTAPASQFAVAQHHSRPDEIFDDGAIHHYRFGQDSCIVWITGPAKEIMFDFEIVLSMLREQKISLVRVIDRSRLGGLFGFGTKLFNRPASQQLLAEQLQTLSYPVYGLMGYSLNATGALIYAGEMPAAGALALSPHTKMPNLEESGGGRASILKRILARGASVPHDVLPGLAARSPHAVVHCHYGSTCRFDVAHAERLLDLPNVSLLAGKHGEHNTLAQLIEDGQMQNAVANFHAAIMAKSGRT